MRGEPSNLGIQLGQLLLVGGLQGCDRIPLFEHIGQAGNRGELPLAQHGGRHPVLGRQLVQRLGLFQQFQDNLGFETRSVRLFHTVILPNPGALSVQILGSGARCVIRQYGF